MTQPSLKQKTVGALLWNLLDRMGQHALLFVVGIIVANILSVDDYALVGMLTIFIAIANIVLESGFSSALIQKQEATQQDFSSVFWFNTGASGVLYLLLVISSPLIARFFGEPQLIPLATVIFLALPINSLTIIQTTLLNKEIRFKALAKVNLLSMMLSGIASLVLALSGMGVWTLALQPVIQALARAVLLWTYSSWRPTRSFSFAAIRELFGYASSLLLASLINTCFLNIYALFIGKIYPKKELGYYTQGNKMSDMGVTILYGSIQNATFPIFSSIQNDPERLIRAYRKTIRFTAFVALPVLTGLIIIARPFIELLLKEEWWPSIPFFQLLCAGGAFTILTAINNNFIKVSGRSDGILKLEYFKIGLTVVALALTYDQTVLTLISGLVLTRAGVYLINVFYTGRFTGYRWSMQLRDLLPYLLLSLVMAAGICFLDRWIENRLLLLLTQTVAGAFIYLTLAYLAGSRILKESIELLFKGGKS